MRLQFTKMHGLGNDFMVIDGTEQSIDLNPEQITKWSDRRLGIGFDQLLVVEKARNPDTDFFLRICNADGSEVEQCGNGIRCVATFVIDKGLSDKDKLNIETIAGTFEIQRVGKNQVSVNMGEPAFEPKHIPFVVDQQADSYELQVDNNALTVHAVSLGNPHCVLQVEDISKAPVSDLGQKITGHERFPEGCNVGFMEVIDKLNIKLRVFERGSAETLACGSGACAAVAVGRLLGLLDEQVRVDLPGGHLQIKWKGQGTSIWMTGPTVKVFEGLWLDQ